jgi:AcrR family transcriptional regulator
MNPAGTTAAGRRAQSAQASDEPEQPSARDRILTAAVDRIASDGIDGVRIARIAMDAGVSTSLVHYHFETREALLAEALEHSYELAGDVRIAEADGEGRTHRRRLAAMIDQCLPFPGLLERDFILWVELWLRAARHPELRPTAARLYARMRGWFREEIEAGIAAGEFADRDSGEIADRILALLDGFGVRALVGDPTVTLEEARKDVWMAIAPDLGLSSKMPPPIGAAES